MFKIKKVSVHGYKNLDGTYSFESNNGYIALIGLNGSGKSNLLEAISIIFDGLINKNGSGIPFDYEIEYDINGHTYSRKKRVAKKDNVVCKSEEVEYPSSLIACYSGEDLRLWHTAYEKYHMEYFNEAVRQIYSSPTFLYVNKYCWEIALIALVCSSNAGVKTFLQEALKISSPLDVELDFVLDEAKKDAFKTHAALNWFNRITQDGYNAINLNTIATTDIFISGKQVEEIEKAKYIFNFLYLLSQPKKNETNKIDKLIEGIRIMVSIAGNKIEFDNLSEGEKKLILIECITKILGDEKSLVLLDEPDAHTHIAMKKNLLKLISEFEGQTILTSHSPVFVDMMNFNNLLYLHDGHSLDMDKIQAINEISDRQITVLESALISSSTKLIITEGPGDVIHIKKAIDILSKKDSRYKQLANNVAILFQGGAKMVQDFYSSALSGMMDKLDKVLFVFDHDAEGREAARLVEKLKDAKIEYIFYEKTYPVKNTNLDFYLEDFYPHDAYSDIALPDINGKPLYCEMKKMASLTTSIKEKISKKINRGDIDDKYFDGYQCFLDELLSKFGFK